MLGTLRISSLQQSGATLYRLTDPGTGRTLVYLKSNDPKYTGMLNEFVGVNGDIKEDPALTMKVITPTSVEAVDQNKVNVNITATVMPPSLLPKQTTARLRPRSTSPRGFPRSSLSTPSSCSICRCWRSRPI